MDVFEPCEEIHIDCEHTQVAQYLRFALDDDNLFWEYYDTEDGSWVVVEQVAIRRPSTAFNLIHKYSINN